MKLHVNDADGPDIEKARLVFNCDIYLDGQKVEGCIMADEEAGEIERYVVREDGKFLIVGDFIETEIVKGVVEIRKRKC